MKCWRRVEREKKKSKERTTEEHSGKGTLSSRRKGKEEGRREDVVVVDGDAEGEERERDDLPVRGEWRASCSVRSSRGENIT